MEIALDEIGQLYAKLGDAGIRSLVDRFYDLMDSETEFRRLREIHPPELTESRNKLYSFLVGRFGGPPLYMEKYGHPMLRARHSPFPIGQTERDQWMACMRRSISEQIHDSTTAELLSAFLDKVADAMKNKA